MMDSESATFNVARPRRRRRRRKEEEEEEGH